MTREPSNGITSPHSAFARVLSFLLLGFIVYGTTVEAAHTHGNLPGGVDSGHAASISDPAHSNYTNGNLQTCSDCLICQLHQDFSTTIVSVTPTNGPLVLSARFYDASSASFHSQSSTPSSGRAPPQNS